MPLVLTLAAASVAGVLALLGGCSTIDNSVSIETRGREILHPVVRYVEEIIEFE